MFARDFWRSPRWHTFASAFVVTSVAADQIDTDGFRVTWTLSEPGDGYVEYGPTTAYGSTTAGESDLLDSHRQAVFGLSSSTTYHYRVKSTNANGVTTYSDDRTVTTEGDPVPTGIGVRYDLYGAGASGNFPAYPVQGNALGAAWPGLTAGTVVTIPSSYASLSDAGPSLSSWLGSTTNVPDGANASTPTVVVFDTSGSGAYGAGTEYELESEITFIEFSRVRSNVILWGYNTKVTQHAGVDGGPGGDGKIFWWDGGGYRDWAMAGFWIHGPNQWAGTEYNSYYASSEKGHGITMSAYEGFTIRDVYGDGFTGDFINMTQWDTSVARHDPSSIGPQDLEIGWCHYDGAARQGIMVNQGERWIIHHCILENTGIYAWDFEDRQAGARHVQIDAEFSDNIVRNWGWQILGNPTNPSYPGGWSPTAFAWSALDYDYEIRNVKINRNRWEGGAMCRGNPDWEGQYSSSQVNKTDGYNIIVWMSNDLSDTTSTRPQNVEIKDNICDLPANQDRNRPGGTGSGGNFFCGFDIDTLTITGNDAGNLGVNNENCTDVTVTDIDGIIVDR